MSRFIDKLTRIRQAEPQPMGFMAGKVSNEKPKMQLVAWLSAPNLDKVSDGLSSADAVAIELAKADDIDALDKVCQVKDGVPGGGWLKSIKGGTLKKALEVVCDFMVFPAAVPLTLTHKDKVGRVLELDATLGEGLLRTVNDLPVDAVLIADNLDESQLTLNQLMSIQRVIYLVNKPILISVPDGLNDAELQTLWDMGVSGVMIELNDEKSGKRLAELHKVVEKLNPAAFRKKARLSPVLPRLEAEPPKPQEEEGGEEEDE
jgi:hypothetical protein